MKLYYDLHIHSCLSPCGEDDMTPANIAGMAQLCGLELIALTDHNSTRNCPAFFAECRRRGIIPVAGCELTTAEDIHIICLFPGLTEAAAFGGALQRHRILIPNRADIFGRQLIYDEHDRPAGSEEHLLINATDLPLEEAKKRIEAGEPFVIRQRIPHEGTTTFHDASFGDITVENKELEDQVLLKSDGLPTYNFANVVDDHLMGITHVVRGSEYLSSAPKYNLLYEAFGWEIPTYVHCSPVMRDAQHKMSKRHGDPSYEDLIREGYLTEAVLNYVALLGWSPKGENAEREFYTLSELAEIFDISGISKSPAVFDINKLRWMNAEYMKKLSPEAFFAKAEPVLKTAVTNPAVDLRAVAALVQPRCEILSDLPERVDFIDKLPEYSTELYVHKKSKTTLENSLSSLQAIVPVLEGLQTWTNENLYEALVALAAKLEVKNSVVLWPLRVAVSGKASTPGGATELCALLGKEESLARIRTGIELLSK